MRRVTVDAHGNVLDRPTEEQRHLAEHPAVARSIGEPTFETTATPEDAPIQSGVSQAPTAEELTHPTRTGPRPTLRPTKEQVDAWQRSFFAAVAGSSLQPEDARHRYVRQWTASEGWPEGKQTDSLRVALARMTERESAGFLAQVRFLVEDEKRANEEALAEARGEAPQEATQDEELF